MASASAVRLSPSVEKRKLKLELLRGSRLKIESLPVSVVVHEHLVRAGCMFFGTTTRRTLTRLHRRRFFFFFFSMMYSGKSGTRSRKKRRFSRFFGLLQVRPDHARSISFFPAHCFLVTVSTSLRKSCATARIDFPDGTSRFRARETSEST